MFSTTAVHNCTVLEARSVLQEIMYQLVETVVQYEYRHEHKVGKRDDTENRTWRNWTLAVRGMSIEDHVLAMVVGN